ncbi:hypothetical protein COPG_00147 [Colwellia phage 9A]|uniref:Uncharacterized protein n=1 Tax=Colwellia phage 9A TaxID=765765 RepID=I3UMM8_9CAUD|nr:hypothetical protein COPG_00147 [Colwellia phage 9A]AFK66743.1 hypothetical protein COPG_00147 [Colwellia phage 9A]
MLNVSNRTQARVIGSILNMIAGRKVVKQARKVNPDGSWSIPRTGGILSLPRICPPRNNGYDLVLNGGIPASFKHSRKRALLPVAVH